MEKTHASHNGYDTFCGRSMDSSWYILEVDSEKIPECKICNTYKKGVDDES